jgi:hypothetical protein
MPEQQLAVPRQQRAVEVEQGDASRRRIRKQYGTRRMQGGDWGD